MDQASAPGNGPSGGIESWFLEHVVGAVAVTAITGAGLVAWRWMVRRTRSRDAVRSCCHELMRCVTNAEDYCEQFGKSPRLMPEWRIPARRELSSIRSALEHAPSDLRENIIDMHVILDDLERDAKRGYVEPNSVTAWSGPCRIVVDAAWNWASSMFGKYEEPEIPDLNTPTTPNP